MDTISITGLRLDMLIGVYEWERKVPQTVELDLEIGLPAREMPRRDRLEDTLDYAAVVSGLEAALRAARLSLLESVAEHAARVLLRDFGAPWVKVSVAKLAPLGNVERIGVTVERGTRS